MKSNISLSRSALESEAQFKSVLMGYFRDFEFVKAGTDRNYGGSKEDLLNQNIDRLYEFMIGDKEDFIPIVDTYQFKSFAMMIRVYDLDGFHFIINSDKNHIYNYDALKEKLDRYDKLAYYNMKLERNLSVNSAVFLNEKIAILVNDFANDLKLFGEDKEFMKLPLRSDLYVLIYRSILHSFFHLHKKFMLITSKDKVIYDVVASEGVINLHENYINSRLKAVEYTLSELHRNETPENIIYKIKEFLRYHIDKFINKHLEHHFYYGKTQSPYIHLFTSFLSRINEEYEDAEISHNHIDEDKTPKLKAPGKELQLKTDEIVLLLHKTGFFTYEAIENLSDSGKAKIIALITGRSSKNIRAAIERSGKKSPVSGEASRKDIDKIDLLLKRLKQE